MSCANITRSTEQTLSTTKNLLWFCDPCYHIHKTGFEKISSLYNEILKSREQNKNLMNELYAKLNTSIKNSKSEILNKNEEISVSYAEMLKKNDENKTVKKDPVIVIKPKKCKWFDECYR